MTWFDRAQWEVFMGCQSLGEWAGVGSGPAQEAGVEAGSGAVQKSWVSGS